MGSITVNYTDGSTETVTLANDGKTLPVTGTGKTVKEIVLTDAGSKTHLIGRIVDATPIQLHLKGNGDLAFRSVLPDGTTLIGSYAEFQLINSNTTSLNGTYKQEADLDLLGTTVTPTVEWTAVGNYDNRFTGTFDGSGKNISNLYINKPSVNEQGLFGYIENGAVRNVHIQGGSVTGNENVGSLAGSNEGGTISDCYNTGTITGNGNVGGLVGASHFLSSTITDCHNTGAITSRGGGVGGIVGFNSGLITNCYNTGAVSGFDHVGGLTGSNEGNIIACYNTGAVTGNSEGWDVGGLVGRNVTADIIACYNTGTVTGGWNVGGVLGNKNTIYIAACYNTGTVTGAYSNNAGGVVGYDDLWWAGAIIANYWANYDGNGIGNNPDHTGVKRFSGSDWPTESTDTGGGYINAWRLKTNGGYWKTLGGWNGGNPSYPKLWWEL
jgi:hypothetical protein